MGLVSCKVAAGGEGQLVCGLGACLGIAMSWLGVFRVSCALQLHCVLEAVVAKLIVMAV